MSVVTGNYPTGGVKVCLPLLPHRSKSAIEQKAHGLGILCGANKPRPPRRLWHSSPDLDRQIAACYYAGTERGEIKRFSARIDRPYWWVKKRAAEMGVSSPALVDNKEPAWSEQEIELLSKHAHKRVDVIARIFRSKGLRRTATAIGVKRKRLHCDTVDIDHYTATRLAGEFGIDPHVVTRWIEKGWLEAVKRGTDRTEQQGGDMYWIKRKAVRSFIVESVGVIDIRKVNKVWFVDLLVNP